MRIYRIVAGIHIDIQASSKEEATLYSGSVPLKSWNYRGVTKIKDVTDQYSEKELNQWKNPTQNA